MSPWHRVALVTGGPVFALVKGHDRVSGTHTADLACRARVHSAPELVGRHPEARSYFRHPHVNATHVFRIWSPDRVGLSRRSVGLDADDLPLGDAVDLGRVGVGDQDDF